MWETINYFWYVRKSTDVEDKQVSSLEDQENMIKKKAELLWINIVYIFSESESAKAPWRERFNEMVARIGKWEAKWIISWKLDRITRNPVDTWTIQYMLQTWKIDKIITNDREYNPVDSWLLFSVETWMSNQFILDLKKNVKRWMDSKTERWVFCWKAPEWYINNRLEKTIELDIDRFDIVRKMWDFMLTWNYSVPKITEIAFNSWWFRRKNRWKSWWHPITVSWMYKMFTNVFYTGCFNWNWEVKQWTHKTMITHEEYNRVQLLLWRKWRIFNSQKHEFAYTWIIKCWVCWASITATEAKRQNNIYTYYHCTRKIKNNPCKQKYLKIDKLEEEILKLLDDINILPECREWCLDILKRDTQKEREEQALIKKNLQLNLKKQKSDLERILWLCIRWIISEEEYVSNKSKIEEDIKMSESKIIEFDKNWNYWNDITEEVFDFSSKVKNAFINWNIGMKKIILASLWKNHSLKDWKLNIEFYPWLEVIKKDLKPLCDKNFKSEYSRKLLTKRQTQVLNQEIILWYSHGELNSDPSLEKAVS